jgi:hypothetical protein
MNILQVRSGILMLSVSKFYFNWVGVLMSMIYIFFTKLMAMVFIPPPPPLRSHFSRHTCFPEVKL